MLFNILFILTLIMLLGYVIVWFCWFTTKMSYDTETFPEFLKRILRS